MKCSKNILAFVLCFTVVITLCPMIGSANGGFSVIDNFDTLEVTSSAFNKYPNSSLGQTSEVFMQDSRAERGYKIVETTGVDGNTTKALETFNTNGDYLYLPFLNTFVHKDGFVTQYSFDIKFTKLPGDNPAAYKLEYVNFFMFDHNNSFRNDGQTSELNTPGGQTTIAKDVWYTFVGKINADGKLSMYMLDAATGEVLHEADTYKTFSDGGSFAVNAIRFQPHRYDMILNDGTTVYVTCQIDNAKVVQYDADTPPAITSASVENGQNGVMRNEVLTFNFSQGLSEDSTVILTSDDDPDVKWKSTADAFGRLTVSFPEMLKRKTTYTLSFDGVINENDVPCTEESITFTTEDLHIWNDIEISSVASDDTTEISFIISDAYSYPEFSGMVMAAAYTDGKMTGLDIVELTGVSTESELTRSFDIGSVSAGTEIQLMLLDNKYHPIPLASGKTEVQ